MEYLNYDEFKQSKWFVEIPEPEFYQLQYAAELAINQITRNRASADIPEVKEAVAAQVYYLFKNGGIDAAIDSSTVQSESIGQYSYSATDTYSSETIKLNPLIKPILYPTGLLYRGDGGGGHCI